MHRPDRRTFLLGSAGATAAAISLLSSAAGKAAPSERVRLCVVGVRGRGRSLASNFAGLSQAQITHVCDVNEPLMAPFAKKIGAIQKLTPRCVQDLRDVLKDKSVDALVVA